MMIQDTERALADGPRPTSNRRRSSGQFLVILLASLLAAPGCAEQNAGPGTRVDRRYLQEIKARIAEYQRTASRNLGAGRGLLASLNENLAEASGEDLGEHGATIAQITAVAKELEALIANSTSSPDAKRKLQELSDLAQKLPGEGPAQVDR